MSRFWKERAFIMGFTNLSGAKKTIYKIKSLIFTLEFSKSLYISENLKSPNTKNKNDHSGERKQPAKRQRIFKKIRAGRRRTYFLMLEQQKRMIITLPLPKARSVLMEMGMSDINFSSIKKISTNFLRK